MVHRAVKRMIEGEHGEPPVAPTIKIVNLSVCDPSRPLIAYLSPWARLLDWLAWRYNLLFIVSAGNQLDDIELSTEREAIRNLGAQDIEAEVIRSIARNYMSRRILSPAESINALSLAGSHYDQSPEREVSPLINPVSSTNMPSPINSLV